MKILIFLAFLIVFISCGKKTDDSSSEVISTTPAIEVDTELESPEVSNSDFTVLMDNTEFEKNEVIVLKIKNTGNKIINHLGFSFAGMPSLVTVTRLNCYEAMAIGDECTFAAVFKNPIGGYHKIKVNYNDYGDNKDLEINLFIRGSQNTTDTSFLYADRHTYNDCVSTSHKQKEGTIASKHNDDFCAFRGEGWDKVETSQITSNPLEVFNTHAQDANEYYCPTGWKLQSFQFEQVIIEEHTSFFGGRKDIIILPGESKELCTKRNLFGCKEKKVFYSRLTKVYCY